MDYKANFISETGETTPTKSGVRAYYINPWDVHVKCKLLA